MGVGNDINEAVRNGMSDQAFYEDHIGDGLDGFMGVQELKVHLRGLLTFPADLIIEHGLDEVWAKVTPAPEDEGLELAGDELRAMRGEYRDEDDS